VLRIVIDARSVSDKKSGIGNTTEALIRHLVPLADDMQFTLLKHPARTKPIVEHERVREIVHRGETKSIHTVLGRGISQRIGAADLYHSPADIVPFGLSCPYVVTLHDLMWVEAPELASAFAPVRIVNGAWYAAHFARSARGARRIIAISQATADAIQRVYPQHSEKVRVVHHGIEPERYSRERAGPRSVLDEVLPSGAEFSLIVGQGSPYKNQPMMIRAFVEAMGSRSDHKLVLVRRFSRVDREMQELLRRPDVARVVVPISQVTDEILFALYRHARMLLFVSRYEGFGLPALEAMAFGLPVLASTSPAVLEVTGNAALHADPENLHDIADKIRRLDHDEPLRQKLIVAGTARVHDFTWERAARKTLDVYREAAAGPTG
jgi:glycosyltransferase involved in cell wall biosynthesis